MEAQASGCEDTGISPCAGACCIVFDSGAAGLLFPSHDVWLQGKDARLFIPKATGEIACEVVPMNNNIVALCASAAIAAVTLFNVPKEQRLEFKYEPDRSVIYFTGTDEQLTELLEQYYSLSYPGWMFDVRCSEEARRALASMREKGGLCFHVDTLDRQAHVQAAYRRVVER